MKAVEYVENGEVVGDNFDEYLEHMFGPLELLGVRNTGQNESGEDNRVAIFLTDQGTIYRPFHSEEIPNV